jgi:uncharacterized protein YcbK (DUF882 family)
MYEFFSDKELACSCCQKNGMNDDFMVRLVGLRKAWGKPMILNSAYRCEKHNKDVGGHPSSYHLAGRAVDVRVKKDDQKAFIKLARSLGFNGIGVGATFIHIDNQKEQRTWKY